MKANYAVLRQTGNVVVIRDIGPWNRYASVTNAAEEVVEEMVPILAGRRLYYYDSEGEYCELVIKDNKFAGFRNAES